jgi:hypothetical protein
MMVQLNKDCMQHEFDTPPRIFVSASGEMRM